MRALSALLLAGVMALTIGTAGADPGPESRVTTIVSPDGDTYYLFAYGNEGGPTSGDHGLAIYKETNGVGITCPQWEEGYPVGHFTQPSGPSGLQTRVSLCSPTLDEKVFDTTQ